VGRALLGHRAGEKVRAVVPNGVIEMKIVQVQ
jgi:transcription elongation GreA/GreB family factor